MAVLVSSRDFGVVGEGFERGDVLGVEVGDELRDEVLFALLGLLRGGDEAVGHAGHRGDDGDDGALGGGGFDDGGGAGDAVGVADGGAAEFHDLKRVRHFSEIFACATAWARGEFAECSQQVAIGCEKSLGRIILECGAAAPLLRSTCTSHPTRPSVAQQCVTSGSERASDMRFSYFGISSNTG